MSNLSEIHLILLGHLLCSEHTAKVTGNNNNLGVNTNE